MDMQSSKTKLFLMELIIIILFFSVAGAVCMNMFAQAKLLSTGSTELTNAMLKAQEAAETIRDTNKDPRMLAGLSEVAQDADDFSTYYDGRWEQVPYGSQDAVYRMRITFSGDAGGDMIAADIAVGRINEQEIYSIHTKRYIGG